MLPLGHDTAREFVDNGEITPDMSCREIGKVVKEILNAQSKDEPAGDSVEGDSAENAENGEIVSAVRVTDGNGNYYLIPVDVLEQYRESK